MIALRTLPRPASWALGIGAAGCLLCALGLAIAPSRVGPAWLAAFIYWIGFPIGGLAFLMIDALVGRSWGSELRLPFRAAAATLPVLAVAILPILLALPRLYPWARADSPLASAYLDPAFAILRTAIYFAIWSALALRLPRPAQIGELPARIAGPGLILLFLSITFAAIDWMMSLEAPWTSSVYGLLVGTGWVLAALAGGILAVPAASTDRRAALGKLLLTAVLLLAYLAFMQFLIVWEENLSHEITWYQRRLSGGWGALVIAAVLLQMILPFLLLLSRRLKRARSGLAAVAGLVLVGHLLAVWWLVLPGFEGARFDWLDLAALAGIGGLAVAVFLIRSAAETAGAPGLSEAA